MRTAICPGSFDPVTNGHMDIIRRSSLLFDRVIVAVMENYHSLHKPNRLFSADERVELIRRCTKGIANVEVLSSGGLLADLFRQKQADCVVKGLRVVSDFEIEFQQALINRELNPALETVFLTAGADSMFLSSSVVKQIAQFDGEIDRFVPEEIVGDVIKRVKELT
ncbi:MAG: pantetheine-phosphate adenylyltransferase [Clostridium sp.]|jgi:pantetheine-phosphate adenylyltransferase|nr:pantetheine-phosphate adenylyltransferase [Clostridium sp.]